jgi:translation initiation factor IF-3
MSIARSLDLDLVEVAPEAQPPVCRIMDYPKFKYDTAQRAKESRRKTTSTSIKEMKYRPKIGQGDFETKTRQVGKFLGEGHKVKITIMFRGREMSHQDLGLKILERVAETVTPIAKVEAAPKVDGRNMVMVLAPDRRAQQAAAKARTAAERTAADDEVAGDGDELATSAPAGATGGSAPATANGAEPGATATPDGQPGNGAVPPAPAPAAAGSAAAGSAAAPSPAPGPADVTVAAPAGAPDTQTEDR